MKYRLAALVSHPIQYQVPLFRELQQCPQLDLTVYFCSDFGVGSEKFDPGFGVKLTWDIPLLEGYTHKFLPNLSQSPLKGFSGLINPSIIRELRFNEYDALWIHGYAHLTNWLAFFGAWITGTPIILRGESHLLNHRSALRKLCKRIVLGLLFKSAGCFLTIGSLNAEYYRYYGVPDEKMFPCPYCVDNTFFSKKRAELSEKRESLKEKLGIAPATPVILYASKMIPRKRAIDLLRAYGKISDNVRKALVLVGDGPDRQNLERYAVEYNLKNVFFAGFKNQTELPEYFAIADVFVLPSTDEPWGLIINEALNFGLPVVTTDQVGAAPDLLRHEENGFIYQVGNIDELAGYLSRLLESAELRMNMGKRSLEIISKWSYADDLVGILRALQYLEKYSLSSKKRGRRIRAKS